MEKTFEEWGRTGVQVDLTESFRRPSGERQAPFVSGEKKGVWEKGKIQSFREKRKGGVRHVPMAPEGSGTKRRHPGIQGKSRR